MITGLASTFADPSDVVRFKEAKARGLSDKNAFKVGDNGIGYWGDRTDNESVAMCAVPPEDIVAKWGSIVKGHNREVAVDYKGHRIVCLLRDTMPHKANITNHAVIDLNPGAFNALHPFGFPKGGMVQVTWSWV